jgi:hypothetical protein
MQAERWVVDILARIPPFLVHPGVAVLVGFLIAVTGRDALRVHAYGFLLARIIHIFEDNKSLLCYKHVV